MSLNPNQFGDSHNWNYSKPEDDGFSLSITGTVVAIQETQAMNFGADQRPTTPAFWENSNQPKMNIRLVLCGPSGGYRTLIVTPASKAAKEGKKKSIHLDLFALTGNTDMRQLIGKTLTITTVAPPANFKFGIGNPRPWDVKERTDVGPYTLKEPLDPQYLVPVLLANQAVSGGTVQAPVSTPAPLPDSVSAMPGGSLTPEEVAASLGAGAVGGEDCPF
jgi:hypothetical protein